MGVRDTKLQPDSNAVKHTFPVRFITATSQTDLMCAAHKPGYEFLLTGAQIFAGAYTATFAASVWSVPSNGMFGATTVGLKVDSTPEETATTAAFNAMVAGVLYHKAIATAIAFTAAHAVTASKFGIILYQMTAAGVVSTKVPAATPTTTMAYATYNAAVAALPAADASNIALGYVVIAADSGGWTAITDDLTDGSDLTSATFVDLSRVATTPAVSALVPVALSIVEASAPTVAAGWGGPESTIVVTYTSGGSGALTNAQLDVEYRPFPLDGEVSRQ